MEIGGGGGAILLKDMYMAVHFFPLRSMLLLVDPVFNQLSHSCIYEGCSRSNCRKLMSSTNFHTVSEAPVSVAGLSIRERKRMGPKSVPWVTTHVQYSQSDRAS